MEVHARKGQVANARAPRPADNGDTGKRRGREGVAVAAPRNPRCLRPPRSAAAAVARAGREAPAPQRLRMPQGVPPNARQQWAEACNVVDLKRHYACANAQGACVRAGFLQAVQEFSALALKVFAYIRGRRSGAAEAVKATRIADGWHLDDAGGEEGSQRGAPASAPVRCAAAGCADRAVPESGTLNPPDCAGAAGQEASGRARPAGTCGLACSAPGCCAGSAVGGRGPTLRLTREQIQEVVGKVSAHHRETAAGLSGWTFDMICAAFQSSDAASDVTLELVNLILLRELPREAFLLHGLLIEGEKTLRRQEALCGPSRSARRGIAFRGSAHCGHTGIGTGLAPLQVRVGTPGGTETVARALASALAEDSETVVITVDMANAFNSIHQAAMFAAVQ